MKIRREDGKTRRLTRIIVTCVTFILVFCLNYFGVFTLADYLIGDHLYHTDSTPQLDIGIAAIDNRTIAAFGPQTEWDRSVYAGFLNRFTELGVKPALVAFDINFTGEKAYGPDKAFADSVQACDFPVIVGSILDFDEVMATDDGGSFKTDKSHIVGVDAPYAALRQAVTYGFNNNQPDEYDSNIRMFLTTLPSDTFGPQKSFPLVIAETYAQLTGEEIPGSDMIYSHQRLRFDYSGGPETFNPMSLCDLMVEDDMVRNLNGWIILVGAYAPGFGEEMETPVSGSQQMFGVEVNANIVNAIFEGRLQTEASVEALSYIFAVLAALTAFLMFSFTLSFDAVICFGQAAVALVLGTLFFGRGVYVKTSVYVAAMLIIYICFIVYHYVAERMVKQQISNAFRMYVAPQIVDEVASSGNYKLELGGRTKDIAVLFVDIRGFTSMSENLAPEEVVAILNEYFEIITNAVFKNNGTIDKFIGDAAMAVFNSPFDLDDYVFRAVCTAWDIAEGSKKLSPILMEKFGRTVSYGVGVNCGPAVIGNMGSKFRMDYTAIGDTVNTSSRLESNAKAGQILISQEVRDRLGDRIEVEEIGVIPLKGKKVGINVFNVTAIHR